MNTRHVVQRVVDSDSVSVNVHLGICVKPMHQDISRAQMAAWLLQNDFVAQQGGLHLAVSLPVVCQRLLQTCIQSVCAVVHLLLHVSRCGTAACIH
jgi:hypothetical protein